MFLEVTLVLTQQVEQAGQTVVLVKLYVLTEQVVLSLLKQLVPNLELMKEIKDYKFWTFVEDGNPRRELVFTDTRRNYTLEKSLLGNS